MATATLHGSDGAYNNATIARGTHGTVLSVVPSGHARIRFGAQEIWVFPSQFRHLRAAPRAQPDSGSDSEECMAEEEMQDLCQRYRSALYAATLRDASARTVGEPSDACATPNAASEIGVEEGVDADASELMTRAMANEELVKPGHRSDASTASSASSDPGLEEGEHADNLELASDDSEAGADPEAIAAAPRPWQCRPSTATWLLPAPIS